MESVLSVMPLSSMTMALRRRTILMMLEQMMNSDTGTITQPMPTFMIMGFSAKGRGWVSTRMAPARRQTPMKR